MTAELQRRPSSEAVLAVAEERRDSEKKDKDKAKRRWYQLLSKAQSTPAAGDSDELSSNHSAAAASPTAAPSPTSTSSLTLPSSVPLSHAASFTSMSSTSSTSSATTGWSFIRKSKALLSSPDGPTSRPIPPPISTTAHLHPSPIDRPLPVPSPSPTAVAAAAPSLHLPIADIVSRAPFASSFRSFLVSRYCQENIDFLLAVHRYTLSYQRQHPAWRAGEEGDSGKGEEERGRVVYAASVKESGVDIAHDKSHYVSLDIDAAADGASTAVPVAGSTNLPKTALDIYHTYILLTGSQSVNIPAHTRLAIEHTVSALQQHNNSGTERQPLSATLTPALFSEAVAEIERLLEREWLTKYYHTTQYVTLVQWMDRRERHTLMKEQATRQKKKLQEQLRRVAAAVRTPSIEPFPHRGLQPVKGSPQRVHVSVGGDGIELHLTPQCSPLSPASADGPLSPISSTLRPSAVRAAGRLRGRDAEEKTEMFSLSVSGSESEWDDHSPRILYPHTPTTPCTPSLVSSVAPLTPITPITPLSPGSAPLFHPTPTPNMYLSPRRNNTRRAPVQPTPASTTEADQLPDQLNLTTASIAASDSSTLTATFLLSTSVTAADTTASLSSSSASMLSTSHSSSSSSPSPSHAADYARFRSPLDSSTPSTSATAVTPASSDKPDKRRRPHAIVTPLPFRLDEANDEHRLPLSALSDGCDDEEHIDPTRPPTLLIQYDEQSDDESSSADHPPTDRSGADKHPTHSPEPSTASLSCSPSPVAGAWPEHSTSNKTSGKDVDCCGSDSECGSEADEDDEERELFDGSTDGTRFFSVIVVEDSEDEADSDGRVQVPIV